MNKGHLPIRGVLFDLDDTLNDRARSWIAFVQWLTRPDPGYLNPDLPAAVHEAILRADQGGRRPKAELFEELRATLPWRSNPSATDIEQLWRQNFPACTVVRDGAKELLTTLRQRGLKTGIVSNGGADMQRAKIVAMGLESMVDVIVISDEVGIGKPDARIFELALQRMGMSADETLFIGDHPASDIVPAGKLGMKTAWLAPGRTWPSEFPPPDFEIEDFDVLDGAFAEAD